MAMQETAAVKNQAGAQKFLREVRGELKKVTWPTRRELTAYTGVVFIAVLLVAFLIWGMDTIFAYLFRWILKG